MRLFTLLISIVLLASCSQLSKKSEIKIPPMREYSLKNGLKVIVAKNQKLPLVNVNLVIYPGSSSDPKGQTGVSFLMAELLEKGTQTKSAEEVAEAFAQLGTSFGESVQTDYMQFGTQSLNYNQEELLKLFAEVITQPAFSEKEFSMLKKRLLASIQKNFDEPGYVASYVYDQSLMGDYVYSRPTQGTAKDVKALKLSAVKSHYKDLFNTQQATLVFTGDWNDETLKGLDELFASWKAVPEKAAPIKSEIPEATKFPENKAQIVLATKPGLKQAQIRIGHKGIRRNNPDYWSLQVANVILGGNFSSRLMREVRVKRGLTYSINSRFTPGLFEGPYTISTFTRFDKIGETLSATKEVVEAFKKEGVTDDEVERAKNFLKGHLIRSFEDPEDVVMTLLRLKIYGLDTEEVTQVIKKVNAVSPSTVNASIREYYHPDEFTQVIYAPKEYEKDLQSFGDVAVKKASSFF